MLSGPASSPAQNSEVSSKEVLNMTRESLKNAVSLKQFETVQKILSSVPDLQKLDVFQPAFNVLISSKYDIQNIDIILDILIKNNVHQSYTKKINDTILIVVNKLLSPGNWDICGYITKYLLIHGKVDVNHKNNENKTALRCALDTQYWCMPYTDAKEDAIGLDNPILVLITYLDLKRMSDDKLLSLFYFGIDRNNYEFIDTFFKKVGEKLSRRTKIKCLHGATDARNCDILKLTLKCCNDVVLSEKEENDLLFCTLKFSFPSLFKPQLLETLLDNRDIKISAFTIAWVALCKDITLRLGAFEIFLKKGRVSLVLAKEQEIPETQYKLDKGMFLSSLEFEDEKFVIKMIEEKLFNNSLGKEATTEVYNLITQTNCTDSSCWYKKVEDQHYDGDPSLEHEHSSLFGAIELKRNHIVIFLLDYFIKNHGLSFSSPNFQAFTNSLFWHAVKSKNHVITQYLKTKGAVLDDRLLSQAMKLPKKDRARMVNHLLEVGALDSTEPIVKSVYDKANDKVQALLTPFQDKVEEAILVSYSEFSKEKHKYILKTVAEYVLSPEMTPLKKHQR